MATYGFKLLEITLHRNTGSKLVNFGNTVAPDKSEMHYLDRVLQDFAGTVAAAQPSEETDLAADAANEDGEVEEVILGSDDVVADETPDTGIPDSDSKKLAVVRIDSAIRYRSAVLLNTVYGIVGDHERAVDPNGEKEDADLSKLATTRTYRALLIAPDEGTSGFLAVEVISRSHAGSRLASRLFQGGKSHNFRIRTHGAVADDDAVKDLVKDARIRQVRLFQTIPSEDAATARTIPAVLTFSIGKGSPEEHRLQKLIPRWLPTKANKKRNADADDEDKLSAKKEANALASWLWPALAREVHFEGAEVEVRGKNRSKRLKPLDMSEGFTYDTSDVRPSDENFIAHVADVVNSVSGTHSVTLTDDWDYPLSDN